MYDSNDVTLDKMAEFTMSEDTAMRYKSYGWDVVTVDGHDLDAVAKVGWAVFFCVECDGCGWVGRKIEGQGGRAIEGCSFACEGSIRRW